MLNLVSTGTGDHRYTTSVQGSEQTHRLSATRRHPEMAGDVMCDLELDLSKIPFVHF